MAVFATPSFLIMPRYIPGQFNGIATKVKMFNDNLQHNPPKKLAISFIIKRDNASDPAVFFKVIRSACRSHRKRLLEKAHAVCDG
jgi:hypothetical protein